ncbi:alpha-L-rhamnosidase C-terminal domain-containing protein [Paenibacillus sp. GCM10027626]|uniref:alpha-L-rhamnosidase C-terminal domain-containing protein n=1 Tax=Paenibacillus sp. GCM10027626 TaxID=3273411 RepID=UPI00362D4193
MLFQGATCFWETNDGANAFGRAGSLCHGWSATPLYFYYSFLLGVRPLEPGFRAFQVAPVPGGFHQASGVVPTPRGPIEVSWKNTETGLPIR